jgi:multiple sugar transport system substrate-binding protein
MAGSRRRDISDRAGTDERSSTPALGRRGFLGLAAAAGSAATLAACGVPASSSSSSSSSGGSTGTLRALYMQQAGYSVDEINAMTKAFESANPGLKVENTFVAYEALHDKIVISAPAGTFDVVLIDCIWPTELASKKMIQDVTDRYPADWMSDILPGTLGAVTYQGKKYGVPWIPGGKVFFYNGAMLTKAGIPATQMGTWDGCVAAAKTLKDKKLVQYPFIWSWSQAEAMICDYTQLIGAFGGQFLDASGKPAFNTGGGLQALEWMVMTIDQGLTNPASTKSLEDDAKKSLLAGQAAMTLNWDYVYAASHDAKQTSIPGQVVMTTSPAGPSGKNPGCNGGMGLSITTGSKQPDNAWKLIAHMASKEQMVAHSANTLPIWKSAYTPELSKGREQMVEADQKTLANLIDRPQVAKYNAISQVLQASLQQALLGQVKPKAALDDAASQVTALLA